MLIHKQRTIGILLFLSILSYNDYVIVILDVKFNEGTACRNSIYCNLNCNYNLEVNVVRLYCGF